MRFKKSVALVLCAAMLITFSSCAWFQNEVNELNGAITGNTYNAKFYDNSGDLFMTMSGEKINLKSNVVKEKTYSDDSGWGYVETLSSVVTINIDGKEVESCGSTMIFAEEGLEETVNFKVEEINSTADGIADNTIIAGTVNKVKNRFGKSRAVIIQSQLGDPICAYEGNKVYWEVCKDLPKTTKLMIDGKALYIHRANFQIVDTGLLE